MVRGNSFLLGLLLVLSTVAGSLYSETDYLPLALGNSWTLSFGPASAELTIKSVRSIAGVRRASLAFDDQHSQFNLLIRATSSGILLEGIEYPSFRVAFSEPEMLFGNGIPGQTWVSPHLNVTLVSDDDTVWTFTGIYAKVRRYDVVLEGITQTWYLAPGIGFVQLGDRVALTLSKLTRNAETQVFPPLPTRCPAVGITANPAVNGDFSTGGKEAALRSTIESGSAFLAISTSWADLEKQIGIYDLSSIESDIAWAERYNLPAVLTIKTIDTGSRSIPADLAALAWDDPRLVARWEAVLAKVLPALNSRVKWINFGNEVDTYLNVFPEQIAAFAAFVQAGQNLTARHDPSLSTGVIFAFDSWYGNDIVFRKLQPQLQHVAFTYYAINNSVPGSTHREIGNVPFDIADMVQAAGAKPLVLTEAGFTSSTEVGSSAELQKAFYESVFAAFAHSGGSLVGANFSFLSDFPDSVIKDLAIQYANTAPSWAFWLSKLGVFDTAGNPKPAWQVFTEQASEFRGGRTCTAGY